MQGLDTPGSLPCKGRTLSSSSPVEPLPTLVKGGPSPLVPLDVRDASRTFPSLFGRLAGTGRRALVNYLVHKTVVHLDSCISTKPKLFYCKLIG